jgi:dihydropyrimidinase
MSILIKSGTLITASETYSADILIEGERIAQVGANLPASNDIEVIDAAGKLVLPGGIDPHTHFDLPFGLGVSSDDHYTGHKAAAFGGTTTAIDFVNHTAGSLKENIDKWHAKADGKAAIDFGFHMNIARLNQDVEAEIPHLHDEGISSIKLFMAYDNMRLYDGEIFKVMRIARNHNMLTMLHAENGDVIKILIAEALAAGHTSSEWHALTRPPWSATEATLRGAALAAQAEAPLYIVHMNTGGEVDLLDYVRNKGLPVMGETCPQYLFFTVDDLKKSDGAKWICSPPMRYKEDNARLWEGLIKGTFQTIGTDHCPFLYDGTRPILYEGLPYKQPGKELGRDNFTKVPNGLPGVGDRMPVMWTEGVVKGRITPNQFVALCSTNAAKIFGLYPQKGSLLPGADADIVIWDPDKRVKYGVSVAHHRTDYNLYEGWELLGYPEKVFLRGSMIVDGDRWLGRAGMGRFIYRKPSSKVL